MFILILGKDIGSILVEESLHAAFWLGVIEINNELMLCRCQMCSMMSLLNNGNLGWQIKNYNASYGHG